MIFNEPGSEQVVEMLDDCKIHALNLAEVMRKLVSLGKPADEVIAQVGTLELDVVEDLRMEQVREIARLAPEARRLGLSLGDCVCLAVAKTEGVTAVTAERRWSELRGYKIKLLQIR
jgi:PIN domain nuclease of toxin-antitoxin system